MPSRHPEGDPFIRDYWPALLTAVVCMFVILMIVVGPGWQR